MFFILKKFYKVKRKSLKMKSDKYQVDDIAHREKNCDFTAQYFVQS